MTADVTESDNPARLTLSHRKLRTLCPMLYGLTGLLLKGIMLVRREPSHVQAVARQIWSGDPNPAIVTSVDPLLVAAYSADLDCVTLLYFKPEATKLHQVRPGAKLLSVNFYDDDGEVADDLTPGSDAGDVWTNFAPTIGEFVSDDLDRIDGLKAAIPVETWRRTAKLAKEYLRDMPGYARRGEPLLSLNPAVPLEELTARQASAAG